MMCKNIILMIKHSIIIFNLCYFLGFAWIILVMVSRDVEFNEHISDNQDEFKVRHSDDFMTYYRMNENSPIKNTIIVFYFAFTTLSTVGFGDFAPTNNPERVACSVILLVGVATFSVVLGNQSAIIEKYKNRVFRLITEF